MTGLHYVSAQIMMASSRLMMLLLDNRRQLDIPVKVGVMRQRCTSQSRTVSSS